jgi:hypothetical protein
MCSLPRGWLRPYQRRARNCCQAIAGYMSVTVRSWRYDDVNFETDEFAKALSVIDGLAADQSDTRAVVEGQHAPPVVLLLIDPAGAVEWFSENRLHRHHGPGKRHGNIVPAGSSRESWLACVSLKD